MRRIAKGDLLCMPAPHGRANRSPMRQTLYIRADGRMSHFHQAARANRDNARPAAGRDGTKVSSFDIRHDTMPVAVGVLPPLHEIGGGNEGIAHSSAINLDPDRGAPIFSERHEFSPVAHRIRRVVGLGIEIGEVKDTHPSQGPNVRIIIWPHPGAPPFGIGNRRVRQNLLIASDSCEALRRGGMPKPAMQGSQTIFSEFHGIHFQTPVAAKGTRRIRVTQSTHYPTYLDAPVLLPLERTPLALSSEYVKLESPLLSWRNLPGQHSLLQSNPVRPETFRLWSIYSPARFSQNATLFSCCLAKLTQIP